MKLNKIVKMIVLLPIALYLFGNTNINVNASKKTTPNLSTYNNYGNYKVKLKRATKIDYEKLDFARGDKSIKTKLLKKGTVLTFSGNLSRFDGPAYVVYGKYSNGPKGTKAIIEMTKDNYELISYKEPKIK